MSHPESARACRLNRKGAHDDGHALELGREVELGDVGRARLLGRRHDRAAVQGPPRRKEGRFLQRIAYEVAVDGHQRLARRHHQRRLLHACLCGVRDASLR